MLRIGQVEATATQDGKYTDGSVAGGIAATRLRAAAFNAMQEELAHIVESAGLALDINDMTQVLKAIQKLTLSRANPFADIKSDGAAAISTALTNLGLGEAAQRDVGTAANQIPDMSAWASGPGWRRTPDGFIEQFGVISFPSSGGAATSTWVAFPISFPTGNIDTLVVYDRGFGSGNMWGATDWSGTGFTAHCNSDGEGARYFARGK